MPAAKDKAAPAADAASAADAAPAMVRLVALDPLKHDGKDIAAGEGFVCTPAQAERLRDQLGVAADAAAAASPA